MTVGAASIGPSDRRRHDAQDCCGVGWERRSGGPRRGGKVGGGMTTHAVTAPNPLRGRVNAALFRGIDWYVHRLLGATKRALFADLPDTVLEIGPGTGAN